MLPSQDLDIILFTSIMYMCVSLCVKIEGIRKPVK